MPTGAETLSLEDDCSIETLKVLIWSLSELPPDTLRIRAGHPLRILPNDEPYTLLSMYGIEDRDTIIVESKSASSSGSGSRSSTSIIASSKTVSTSQPTSHIPPPSTASRAPSSVSESRAGVFGILNEFLGTSSNPKPYDPLLPPPKKKVKKVKAAVWKQQRDLKHSTTLPKEKKKRNVIEQLFGSELMAEVGQAEKDAYFDAWLKREISALPEMTDLETIEAELRDQANFTEWDPEQYDFTIIA